MTSTQAPMDLFRSKRLLYRSAENSTEDKEFFQNSIINDSTIQTLSSMRLKRPKHQTSAEDTIRILQEAVLGVIICLPCTPPEEDTNNASESQSSKRATDLAKATPIGYLSFFPTHGPDASHHRNAMIGLSFAEEYRGKGYGGEAVNWALDWAFQHGGFHRICIGAFSYNHNALKLYRRLGFVDEGREREAVLYLRKWHDIVNLSMLEHEWEALRNSETTGPDVAS